MSVATATAAAKAAPGLGVAGWSRLGVELKSFFRDKRSMIFTFSFPIVFLLLFSSIFSGEIKGTGVDIRQYLVAGMMASGIFGMGFSTMAIRVAMEQDDGTLKRLTGTPMPKGAYFIGKLGMVVIAAVLQAALMLAIGVVLCGIKLPTDPMRWLTFAWVLVLGVVGCALLGIAYTRIIKNAKSAPAIVQLPYVALQFISGVFFVFTMLPRGLRTAASLFPLKWMAQGLRSVFLPDSFVPREVGGSWDRPTTALVLAGWTLGAFILCTLTFRWRGRNDD